MADDGIAEQLERRRHEAAAAWDLDDGLVLVGAGEPVPVPGRYDRTYPFRSHSEYLYLTDRERPRGVLAFDPADGWTDFVAPVTPEERMWEGAPDGELDGVPLPELEGWLSRRANRPVALLGSPRGGVSGGTALTGRGRGGLVPGRGAEGPGRARGVRAP